MNGTVELPAPFGERSRDTSTTTWGLASRNGVNFEGGYGVTDTLVIGGFLALGGRSETMQEDPDDDVDVTNSTFDMFIAPKIDYTLLPGERIRPFFGGALGLNHHSDTNKVRDNNVTRTASEGSLTGLALMGRVGARFFLSPGFSLDPAFMFMWMPTASGSYTLGNTQYDAGANGFTLGLTVAASGWVGL